MVLIAIIASIMPPVFFPLFVLAQALILTTFGYGRVPLFYVQTKENKYLTSEGVRDLLRYLSYFVYSILFLIGSLLIAHLFSFVFNSVFGESMLPSLEGNLLESSVFLGIWILFSGVTFIFTIDFFAKLINKEKKIVIGDGTNE
jgi:hypothetical protein